MGPIVPSDSQSHSSTETPSALPLAPSHKYLIDWLRPGGRGSSCLRCNPSRGQSKAVPEISITFFLAADARTPLFFSSVIVIVSFPTWLSSQLPGIHHCSNRSYRLLSRPEDKTEVCSIAATVVPDRCDGWKSKRFILHPDQLRTC